MFHDEDKYWEEIENMYIDNAINDFTLNLMGRCAYKALYMFAREKLFTEKQARDICASKWPRHNEERLVEIFYKALEWSLPQTIERDMINYTEDEQA